MLKLKPIHKAVSLVAASAVCLSGQVLAQQPVLEEVVVTANKRAQSLQDVSLSVTAVSAADLIANGISDVSRLDLLTPGLQFSQSGNDVRPVMRGARTEQVESADVAVSFYTDGLYRPRHGQALAGFIDVERVEALRGPQGTLFGRNSFGGAINVITKDPSFEAMDFGVALTGGDYSHLRGEGFFNAPLGDKVAIRLAGVVEERDPYVENVLDDDAGLKDADTQYVRGKLMFEPTDAFSIKLRAEYWKDDANGAGDFGYRVEGVPVNPVTGLTNPISGVLRPRLGRSDECVNACGRFGAGLDLVATPGLDTAVPVQSDPYKIAIDFKPQREIEDTTLAAEINWALSFADLKVTLANMDYEETRLSDGDLSPNPVNISGNEITSDTNTLEFQLTSNSDGPLEWVAGLYFLQEDLTNAFLFKDLFIVDPGTNTPDLNQPLDAWASFMKQIQLETDSQAVYGQATLSVTDTVRLIAGLRYTEDERTWDIFDQNPDDLSQPNFTVLSTSDADETWDAVTWKAGAEYDLNDDSMVYGTVSTGFLAGNAQGAFDEDDFYDEQNVTAYELGIKTTLVEGAMRLNVALYYNDFEDLLSTRFQDFGTTTLSFFDNAGAAEATGLEVELDWLATEALRLGLRGAFQKAEFGDFVTPNVFEEGGEVVDGADNQFQLDGSQIPMSPDITLTLTASYDIDLNSMGILTPAVTLYYSDDYRSSDAPFSYGEQDSYTKTDLSLSWMSPDNIWTARLFVNNVEDEEVLIRATRYGGNVAITDYAPPRVWGLRVAYNY